jgi:hypothetical protein
MTQPLEFCTRFGAAAVLSLSLSLSLLAPALGAAQQLTGRDVGPALATRRELEDQLARLAQGGRGRPEAALIRSRLDSGDFQSGDRIFLRVEGEQQLTDTFTVGAGPVLALPQIGAVPLGGTLRSELHGRVEAYVSRYVRDPVVLARPLIRILVEGEVARPGFYAVPPEQPVADVLSAAGLTQHAKVAKMRVDRGGSEIWGGAALQRALAQGYSLDQLNLRAGDRVFVPGGGDAVRTLQILSIVITIPAAIFTLTRLH